MDPTYPPSDISDILTYTPEGCYTEGYNGRAVAFRQSQLDSKSMTTKVCLGACKSQNFPLAALEFGGECYCGVVLGNGTASAPDTECSTKCTGDSTDFCGGRGRLNLYVASDLMSTEPCSPFVLPPPIVRSSTSASITPSTILSSPSSSTPVATASITPSTSSTYSAAKSSTTSAEPTGSETFTSEASITQSTSSETVMSESYTSVTSTSQESSSETTIFEKTSSPTLIAAPTTTDSTTSETMTTTTTLSGSSTAPSTESSHSSTAILQSISSAAGTTTSDGSNYETTTSESSSSSSSPNVWSSPSSSTPSITSSTSSPTSPTTTPLSTSSSTLQATTTTTPKTSTMTPPTSTKPITSYAPCNSIIPPTPSCEFVTGKFCSKPIRVFSDHPTCRIAVAECILQIADCFVSAGWPASLQCAKYQSWCQSVSTYCGDICPGGKCTKSDCVSKNPPLGGQRTTTSTTINVCPTSTSTSSATTTSSTAPIPTVTSVCLLPNGPSGSGYSNGKCVGGIQPPALTCNNIRQDFTQFPLKLYTSKESSQCSGYPRTKVPQACKDACSVQYNSCVSTYATGCKGQTQSGDRDSYDSAKTNPNASAFAPDGSLNYITTLSTLHTIDAIAKHLSAHQKILKKKHENILNTVEGDNALCLEIETTIEFIGGGGMYLPGLDDNFLADRLVTFPIIHVVQFDHQQKIQQLRLFWDQGSILKQVEVVGSRGKNWPIRDGKDHVKLIASSAAAASSTGTSRPTLSNDSQDPNEVVITSKPTEARKNATRDPHASLSLFSGRDDEYEASQKPTIAAPRGSARPPPRDYNELFGDNDPEPARSTQKPTSPKKGARPGSKDQTAKPAPRDYHDLFVGDENDASPSSKARATSPQKENAPITKAGSGKNFQPNRLFGDTLEQSATPGAQSPDKLRNPHPTKFNHFDFNDEPPPKNAEQTLPNRPQTKHQNQWDFKDFSTPEKIPQKIRSQDVRHFGWGDDDTSSNSPPKNPNLPQPRRDAKSQFEYLDDGTPPGGRRATGLSRGHAADRGAGLYKNSLFNEDLNRSPEKKIAHPLSTVTNLKDRHKDFDPHFEMNDESPAGASRRPSKPIPEARAKVVKMMDAQWEATDQSPEPTAKKTQARASGKENQGIKLGGDGMGGRKDAVRSWGFGDESDEDGVGGQNGGKFQPAKKQQKPADDEFWNY
ncbi:MAG: hypothetical protein Q9182_005519 [Xanthomendoza sp. 2 TL-2023]